MNQQVVIVGAGISGLACAIELEKKGFSPVILDKNCFVGGRLATDFVDGFPLDHGFQVLLTEYPEAKRYLDLEALDLKTFLPGAVILNNQKQTFWGDPLRDSSFLFSTAFSSLATLSDKLKIVKLKYQLASTSIDEIFQKTSISTYDFLKEYRFSDKIISNFFKPFFSGIFLEDKLETSCRMFLFVFKLFGEGSAAIPAKGMNAIALQLKNKLERTTFRLEQEVIELKENALILSNQEQVPFDTCICTFDKKQTSTWHSCDNLYFRTTSPSFDKPIIGLFAAADSLINNFHFLGDVFSSASDNQIVSATVVKNHDLSATELVEAVKQELQLHLKLENLCLVKHFNLPHALPIVNPLCHTPPSLTKNGNIIYTGDYVAQGSINSAMAVGRMAAEMV